MLGREEWGFGKKSWKCVFFSFYRARNRSLVEVPLNLRRYMPDRRYDLAPCMLKITWFFKLSDMSHINAWGVSASAFQYSDSLTFSGGHPSYKYYILAKKKLASFYCGTDWRRVPSTIVQCTYLLLALLSTRSKPGICKCGVHECFSKASFPKSAGAGARPRSEHHVRDMFALTSWPYFTTRR